MSYNPKGRTTGRYCLIPSSWTPTKIEARRCDDRSHAHLTRNQIWQLEKDGVVEWIHTPRTRHEKGLLKLRLRLMRMRDLSCRVGATLAVAVDRDEMWAKVMLNQIDLRYEREIASRTVDG